MRLTDAPKPLAEMKPEVAWPADVQQVMDKALSRDVTQRYQNATEFGNALYRAIDRMPETAAAEMGTQVMGAAAVPATRVASQPVAPSGAATVAVPTPVASATVTQSAAPGKKKNMIPLMGGIAAVVVIGAGAAFMLRGGKAPATAAADTTKPVVQQQAQGTAPVNTQAVAPNPGSANPANSSSKTVPLSQPVSKPADADKALSVDQRLQEILNQSKDQAKAQSLLATLNQLTLSTNLQKATAGLAKYNIYLFGLGDQDKACSAIEDVEGVSKGTKVEQLVTQTIRGCTG